MTFYKQFMLSAFLLMQPLQLDAVQLHAIFVFIGTFFGYTASILTQKNYEKVSEETEKEYQSLLKKFGVSYADKVKVSYGLRASAQNAESLRPTLTILPRYLQPSKDLWFLTIAHEAQHFKDWKLNFLFNYALIAINTYALLYGNKYGRLLGLCSSIIGL